MACSSGVATVRATTSAEAPRYVVVTCTVGGDNVRILSDGQERRRRKSEHHNEDTDDSSKSGVIDEEVGQFHRPLNFSAGNDQFWSDANWTDVA